MSRPCWVLLAVVAVGLLATPQAQAHAELQASDPPAGARLTAAPDAVTVVLTEPVDQDSATLRVVDAAGRQVDQDDLAVEEGSKPVLRVHLMQGLGPGPYTLRWTALSGSDGHETSGTVGFAVGNATPPESRSTDANRADPASLLSRVMIYAGFALAFAATAFLLWVKEYPAATARKALAIGAVLHHGGILLLLRTTVTGSGLPLETFFATDAGQVLLFRAAFATAASITAVYAFMRGSRPASWLAASLLAATALGASRLGHASSAGAWAIGVDLLHILSASVWVGGLALLVHRLRQAKGAISGEEMQRLATRFGQLALIAVIGLALSGLLLSITILGLQYFSDPGGVLGSTWGALLLAKVLVAAGMVFLATLNRYVLLETPATRGVKAAFQRSTVKLTGGRIAPLLAGGNSFRRAVAAEATLGALVILLAGALTAVSPPQPTPVPSVLALAGSGDSYAANLVIAPAPHLGDASALRARVTHLETGVPLVNNTCGSNACVTLSVAFPNFPGSEAYTLNPDDGTWSLPNLLWTQAGNATLTLQVSSGEVFEDTITVQARVEGTASQATPPTFVPARKRLESPLLGPGDSWSMTFDSPLDQPYVCEPHPWMEAHLEVLPRTNGTPRQHTVEIYEDSPTEWGFRPDHLAIQVGDTVTWVNHGNATHTATRDLGH